MSASHFRALARLVISCLLLIGCERSASEGGNVVRAGDPVTGQRAALVGAADTTSESFDSHPYDGVNSRGFPNYATGVTLSRSDAAILLRAYGVEDPRRLYIPDSTEDGLLKYDRQVKRCPKCYVNSDRIGSVSVRRMGESWEKGERRVRNSPARLFTRGAHPESQSLNDLDVTVRPIVRRMLDNAVAAGFQLRVSATLSSPLREAFLMAQGGGRTYRLTSNHSYGDAVDIVVGERMASREQQKAEWIRFRRWVTRYKTPTGESFRILGTADRTWDRPHVELLSSVHGFHTISEAVARGRSCLATGSRTPCNFPPHLPQYLNDALVQQLDVKSWSVLSPAGHPDRRSASRQVGPRNGDSSSALREHSGSGQPTVHAP